MLMSAKQKIFGVSTLVLLLVVAFYFLQESSTSERVVGKIKETSADETVSNEAIKFEAGGTESFEDARAKFIALPEKDSIRRVFEERYSKLSERRAFVDALEKRFRQAVAESALEKVSQDIFLLNELDSRKTVASVEYFFGHLKNADWDRSEQLAASRLFMLRVLAENQPHLDISRALTLAQSSCSQSDGCQYEKDLVESLGQ